MKFLFEITRLVFDLDVYYLGEISKHILSKQEAFLFAIRLMVELPTFQLPYLPYLPSNFVVDKATKSLIFY